MADGLDDMNDFSNEEFDDDFDPTMEGDLDEDIDIDDIEEDDDDDAPSSSSSSPSPGRQKDDYGDSEVETAIHVNPKRQQARRKNVTLIEGLVHRNELDKEEGQRRAWAMLKDKSAVTSKLYAITEPFELGDYIKHPTFGEGFVIEMPTDTKITVLFEQGIRKLVCNKR